MTISPEKHSGNPQAQKEQPAKGRLVRTLIRLGILAIALAACSRVAEPSSGPAGVVRFSLAEDPTTLDPLFMNPDPSSAQTEVGCLLFEPFVALDPAGRAQPVLLSRIPSRRNGGLSADGRTIVYHLRPNLRWSDGAALTSADVLFTLHAILDPRNPVRSREGYDLIDRASAPDAHTVVLHLRSAWAPATLTYFSYGTSSLVVVPAHVLRSQMPLYRAPFNGAPTVSDGPYTFVAWKRGDSIELRANSRYWRGAPPVSRLDIRITPDPSANLLLLQSGSVDWNLIAPAQYALAARDPHMRFVVAPSAVVASLVFNTAHPPLDERSVRRAIAMSIDRQAISTKITLGRYPVTDSLQPQFSWAYDPSIRQAAYNPHAADALLDRAGWKRGADGVRERNGERLHLTYMEFPESITGVRVAELVQAELRERGIAVSVENVSSAQLFLPKTGMLAEGRFDLAYIPFSMGADPDDSFILSCGAPSNYMRWCDPQLDRLERQARSSVIPAVRRRIYSEIARRVADQAPLVNLFNARYLYAYRDRLSGFDPNAFLPTWNAWAWKI
jgi:peptide/nickel transport system substrate-binding protein